METRILPEAFHPGQYIREEAEDRGWSPGDLAAILGYKQNIISDLYAGRRSVSTEMAKALGDAFESGAQYWLNLQSAYRLATSTKRKDSVAKKAKLYSKVPIREIIRRGWIEATKSIDVLEAEVCKFLEINNIDETNQFACAARKSDDYGMISPLQMAWLMRAKKLAESWPLKARYSKNNFSSMMSELAALRVEPEEIRKTPDILAKHGIRFLIVEPLPKAKIDGACFWLNAVSPVIVLSLRYDRIDGFWFNLAHELAHVKSEDGRTKPIVETLLVGDDAQPTEEKPKEEQEADKFAVEFLVNQEQLSDFISRHHPFYSKNSIIARSRLIGVHPGIIVGQLHHRRKIPWSNLRGMLVKIREIITATAPTDGWGKTIS